MSDTSVNKINTYPFETPSVSNSTSSNDKPSSTTLRIQFGWPIVMMTWDMLKEILIFTYLWNGINIAIGLMFIYAAVHTKLNIGDFINWVTDGDGTSIPIALGLSGFFSVCLNIGFIVTTLCLVKKKRNRRCNAILFILVIVDAIFVVVLFTVAIYCIVHAYTLHGKLHSGIIDAINQYGTNFEMKQKVDFLQIKFHCCGSKSYSEWFDVAWVDTTLADVEIEEKMRDDAPFSCCSIYSLSPCIHHSLMSVGTAYVYAPETNLSIYERGCQTTLLSATKVIAWKSFLALLILSISQAAVGLSHRLLQTAHIEMYKYQRNSFWHTGWLIGSYKGKTRKQPPEPPPIPDELKD